MGQQMAGVARRRRSGDDGAFDPVPPAVTQRRPPAWRSPRFGVGIVLVAGSVALGSWAIERAAGGQEMWVARHDLAPGDPVGPDDLRRIPVSWDGEDARYVVSIDLPTDSVITSFVGEGELLPASALGSSSDVEGRPVTVPVPAGVTPTAGSLVDLWAVPGDDEAPHLIADGALVLGVEEDTGLLRSGSGTVARVLVDVTTVPTLLAVQAAGGTVTLVERPGG